MYAEEILVKIGSNSLLFRDFTALIISIPFAVSIPSST